MSLTDRDRKIVMFLVPLLAVLGYWFLLLGPKREAASRAGTELAKQEQKRDAAQAKLAQAKASKQSFASDYASLVRLGKAIPSSVDMPSLIVQLDHAASGTGIRFSRIATGDAEGGAGASGGSGSPASGAPASSSPAGGAATPPADAGGSTAQSAPGQATEKANETAGKADGATAQREQAGSGGTPPAAGSTDSKAGGGPPAADASGCAAGLKCVPLQFEFSGGFFDLADFFHRLKRFVHVANDRIQVQGRLLTIDNFKFSSDQESFPALKAEVTATVYLAPKSEGATAGATPAGPAAPGPGGQQAATPPTPPTAAATP